MSIPNMVRNPSKLECKYFLDLATSPDKVR